MNENAGPSMELYCLSDCGCSGGQPSLLCIFEPDCPRCRPRQAVNPDIPPGLTETDMRQLDPAPYDGDYSEVPGLMKQLGFVMGPEVLDYPPGWQKGKFEALQRLLAIYGHWLLADITKPLDEAAARDFVEGAFE
jgi:hypothetical protein